MFPTTASARSSVLGISTSGSFRNHFNPFESPFRQQPNDSNGTPPPPQFTKPTVAYNSTCIDELDWRGKNCVGKIISISGMPVFNLKSHEELRWEEVKDICGVSGSMPPPTIFLPAPAAVKESSSPVSITGSSISSLISNTSPLSPFSGTAAIDPGGDLAGFSLTQDPTRLDLSAGFEDLTGNGVKSNIFLAQNNINQEQQYAFFFSDHSSSSAAAAAVTENNVNPFGILPILRNGISNLPVQHTRASTNISSYLSPHRLSQRRRTKFAVRKYDPKCDRPKVAFFDNDEGIVKTDVYLIPRKNPRALLTRK